METSSTVSRREILFSSRVIIVCSTSTLHKVLILHMMLTLYKRVWLCKTRKYWTVNWLNIPYSIHNVIML